MTLRRRGYLNERGMEPPLPEFQKLGLPKSKKRTLKGSDKARLMIGRKIGATGQQLDHYGVFPPPLLKHIVAMHRYRKFRTGDHERGGVVDKAAWSITVRTDNKKEAMKIGKQAMRMVGRGKEKYLRKYDLYVIYEGGRPVLIKAK